MTVCCTFIVEATPQPRSQVVSLASREKKPWERGWQHPRGCHYLKKPVVNISGGTIRRGKRHREICTCGLTRVSVAIFSQSVT